MVHGRLIRPHPCKNIPKANPQVVEVAGIAAEIKAFEIMTVIKRKSVLESQLAKMFSSTRGNACLASNDLHQWPRRWKTDASQTLSGNKDEKDTESSVNQESNG